MPMVVSQAGRLILAADWIACQFLLVVSYFVSEEELHLSAKVSPTRHKAALIS